MVSKAASAALASTLALTGCAAPQSAVLRRFEQTLAAQDSATAALGAWCAAQGIAAPATIAAQPVVGGNRARLPGLHTLLAVEPDDPLGYRHVRLTCGGVVLSEAHNWYVPHRLTPDMNTALAQTDTPFGKVAAPLRFRRERLSSQRGPQSGCPAGTILTHRALLRLPDGTPLSLVMECYTAANLARAVR